MLLARERLLHWIWMNLKPITNENIYCKNFYYNIKTKNIKNSWINEKKIWWLIFFKLNIYILMMGVSKMRMHKSWGHIWEILFILCAAKRNYDSEIDLRRRIFYKKNFFIVVVIFYDFFTSLQENKMVNIAWRYLFVCENVRLLIKCLYVYNYKHFDCLKSDWVYSNYHSRQSLKYN